MKVICPECNTIIPASDLNMLQMAAKCVHCNSVFDFSNQLDQDAESARRHVRHNVPEVTQPKGITVSPDGETLSLSWRMGNVRTVVAMVLLFIGLQMLAAPLSYLTTHAKRQPDSLPIMEILVIFMIIYYVYHLLSELLNKTTLRLSNSELTITNGPLPPKSKRRFLAGELAHVYVLQTSSGDRFFKPAYQIVGVEQMHGTHREIASGLRSLDDARYVRQTIEEQLSR